MPTKLERRYGARNSLTSTAFTPEELGALRGPVAARAGAVLLATENDEGRALYFGVTWHGRIED
jgi:hypothetical protein